MSKRTFQEKWYIFYCTFPCILKVLCLRFDSSKLTIYRFPVPVPEVGDQFAGKSFDFQFYAAGICWIYKGIHPEEVGGNGGDVRVYVGVFLGGELVKK